MWLWSSSSAVKQSIDCETLKEGPHGISAKRGQEATSSFASPIIHPYSQLHVKERTGFIRWHYCASKSHMGRHNTFFDCLDTSRSTWCAGL